MKISWILIGSALSLGSNLRIELVTELPSHTQLWSISVYFSFMLLSQILKIEFYDFVIILPCRYIGRLYSFRIFCFLRDFCVRVMLTSPNRIFSLCSITADVLKVC